MAPASGCHDAMGLALPEIHHFYPFNHNTFDSVMKGVTHTHTHTHTQLFQGGLLSKNHTTICLFTFTNIHKALSLVTYSSINEAGTSL